MTARRRLPAPLVLLVTLLAGCGSSKQAATGSADPAAWAPAGAPVYVEATIRPGEPLRSAIDSVAQKVTLNRDWRAKLTAAFNRSSNSNGVTYAKDIDPWLGGRVGVFVTGSPDGGRPPFAVIVDVRDEQKLSDELDHHPFDRGGQSSSTSYRDVKYRVDSKGMATGVIKGALVAGNDAGLRKVIDVSKGDGSLAGDAAFTRAKAQVTPQRVAFFYVDFRRALSLVPSGTATGQGAQLEQVKRFYGLLGVKPFAAALTATPSSITLEAAVTGAPRTAVGRGSPTPLLNDLPGDAWLATGSHDYGAQIQRTLGSLGGTGGGGVSVEQLKALVRLRTGLDLDRDLLGWMGDAAIYVRGMTTKGLGGAIVISSKDPAASQRAIPRLGKAISQLTHRPVKAASLAGARGFTLPIRSGLQPVVAVARGDRVVIGYGAASVRDALTPAHHLGDSPELHTAVSSLGSGLKPSFYVAVAPILGLVRSIAGSHPKFERALPYLRAYRFLIAGSQRAGDTTRARMVVGLR